MKEVFSIVGKAKLSGGVSKKQGKAQINFITRSHFSIDLSLCNCYFIIWFVSFI